MLGFAASCAVLATYLMRTMAPLRLVAIVSNVLFISYGYVQDIYPVFFLHVILLPINTWQFLALQFGERSQSQAPRQVLRPAYGSSIGSRSLAPWFAAGLLAGLIGPLTLLTASAEPAHVRVLADQLIVECQSTASSLALRLMGKTHGEIAPYSGMGRA
jgi:hypothetical protein